MRAGVTHRREAKLHLLEEARATVRFTTGMAEISATFFALLRVGDHVVSSRHVFGNTASVERLDAVPRDDCIGSAPGT
ncbi:PLP-dependent transferase [Beijerinckia sp. L45]|uniref:PLP-dependent transferase n=1 Tax=Beijerinckia sp. L45 TaxID=1641855 RepID=UPI00131AEFA3|nr:PLP-dependent transferase [Beijerinckia sp. L45]